MIIVLCFREHQVHQDHQDLKALTELMVNLDLQVYQVTRDNEAVM